MGVTLDNSICELSSTEMAEHRNHVHAEARERISGIGGALRVSLNNLVVGSLREYIALSRHQLEMSEYISLHTGSSDDPDDLWIQKIDWPTGQYHSFRMATRLVDESEKTLPAAWAVEQIRDVMWRVRVVGSVLGRSGKHLVATDADGLTELSNHQCEIADFMRTGRFRKVPRRRKASYLGGDGTQSAETAQRVRELGEALKEYQGRIEIMTVREFIALSKHQCELAGMVIASEREMKANRTIELVHYEEAYGLKGNGNVDSRFHGNDGNGSEGTEGFVCLPCGLQGHSREGGSPFPSRSEKATTLDTPACHARGVVKPEHDKNKDGAQGFNSSFSGLILRSAGQAGKSILTLKTTENVDSRFREGDGKNKGNHASGVAGEVECRASSPSGPPLHFGTKEHRDCSGNGPYVKNTLFEAVRLNPDSPDNIPRVPFLPGGKIPVPTDGRWVRVETPDGPLAIRRINSEWPPDPEYYLDDDVWEDDYWNEDWDDKFP